MNPTLVGPIITAIAGFLGVLIGTALVPSIRGYFSRKKAAQYLAIRVVCILDKYVDDCAVVANDWGEEDQEGLSRPQVSAPSSPTYPGDLDWQSIGHRLMYELLALPAAADKIGSIVSNAGEFADPPDYEGYFETRSFQYATIGLRAYELTEKLRKLYDIRELETSDWDPVDQMKRQLREIRDRQQKRVKAWEAMDKPSPLSPADGSSQPKTA